MSERAYRATGRGQPSDLVPLPEDFWDREGDTRTSLVEKLADFDDSLLEQLLEDVQPSKEEIYKHLTEDFQKNLIVPVIVGAAGPDMRRPAAMEGAAPRDARVRERPRHSSASPSPARRSPRSSRPITCRIPGKLSLSRVWRGPRYPAAPRSNGLRGSPGAVRLLADSMRKVAAAESRARWSG